MKHLKKYNSWALVTGASDGIAKEALSVLGKTDTVRPGFLSKVLGYSLLTAPRKIRSMILKQIMASMIFGGNK